MKSLHEITVTIELKLTVEAENGEEAIKLAKLNDPTLCESMPQKIVGMTAIKLNKC